MAPEPLRFGPFAFDPRTDTVRRDGEPLALGHRAIRLLACLLTRPGEILTKSELMDAAWPEVVVEEANLTVQIAALRRALSVDGGRDWIITIPRIGYRFVGNDPAPLAQEATSEREPPSIVVGPFAALSQDRALSYLAEGLMDDIAVALGKLPALLVISRVPQDAPGRGMADPRQLAPEPAPSGMVTGSIRESNGRLRVIAQLLDGATGVQQWAERFEGAAEDIFALQDEVARSVVGAVRERFTSLAIATTSSREPVDVEVVDLVLRARSLHHGPTQNAEVFARGVELLRSAIDRDPTYADAYITLADAHVRDFLNRWSETPDQSLLEARRLSDKAVELAPEDPVVHQGAALVSNFLKDFARADRELERAEALDPNHPSVLDRRGSQLLQSGTPLAAIPFFERRMRLDPAATIHSLHMLGLAYLYAERYETAAALFRERILQVPGTDMSRGYLAAALGHLGRLDEARQVWTELKAINPSFSLRDWLARHPIRDPAVAGRILEGVWKAGLVGEGQD